MESLRRRLERERRTREAAELISERATRQLYDRQRELELLEAVANASNAALTINDALQVAVDRICAHTQWPVGHAYVCGEDRVMRSATVWHFASDDRFAELRRVSDAASFKSGEGLPGRILGTGRPLWIEDVVADENFPRARGAIDLGVRASFGFPVLVGDEVAAVLEFFTAVAVEPDESLLRLVAQIGTQLGRVVERVRNQEHLSYQATHDALTGLPNRVMILEHLEQGLARLGRLTGIQHAVLFIDLDRFKEVNDTIGHAAGDQVLREVAGRLGSVRRKSDILGRLSGDEFVLVCQDLPSELHAAHICQRLAATFEEDFVVGEEHFRLSASIGVAFASKATAATGEQLIKQADAAMYRAKSEPGGGFVIFDKDLQKRVSRRLSRERALRTAVDRDELFLVYQPQVELRTWNIVGLEALVRWRQPEGVIPPAEFIPLAEETGIIVPIGAWVLEEACRQASSWLEQLGKNAPWISVNLSVRQLADASTLPTVTETLARYPTVSGKLFFEVTESVLLNDAEGGLKVLSDLKHLGSEIAIDDFGTGYASLSYLRRFPASALKIDRSFVTHLTTNPTDRAIVSSVIDLAHALELRVVAEGVETLEQLKLLRDLGCDHAQGFYLARPNPAAQTDELLHANNPFSALAPT